MSQIVESVALGTAPTGKINNATPPATPAPTSRTSTTQTPPGAPTSRTSAAQPGRAAPNSITSRAADPEVPPFALNHARILYASALPGSSVTATTGTGAANVLNPATYNRWSFTGSASLTITLSSSQTIDAVGLGAHNFTNATASIEYSTSDAGAWVSFAPSQSGRAAMLFLSSSAVSVKRLRVNVSGSGALVLGVVYAGVALQMQRPTFKGVEPVTMARNTEYQSTISEGGQWLGRNVVRQSLRLELSFKNLSAAWVRSYFDPFIVSAIGTPFFIAWNPQDYPRETAYAWTTGDIAPTHSGPRDLMSVTIKGEGVA